MVRDQITDGKRIAQLLASELSGLQTGPLDAVTVVDADVDAVPSETGTEAYRVAYHEEPVATAFIYPTYAELSLQIEPPWPDQQDPPAVAAGDEILQLNSGAAVKQAVDAIRQTLAASDDTE